jgi:hypothetical protein
MSQAPWRSGRVVSCRSKGCWFAPRLYSLVYQVMAWRVKRKITFLENFTLYLRNSRSLNLRAIESCICGLRPIERKMRSILRQCTLVR